MTRKLLATIAMIVAIVVVIVGGAGVAYAYWSAGGSGTGFGANGTTTPLTLSSGTPTGTLLPGGQTDVRPHHDQPEHRAREALLARARHHPGHQRLQRRRRAHRLHASAPCRSPPRPTAARAGPFPARSVPSTARLSVTLTNALSMSLSAVNACQGATFTVYLVGA